MKADEGELSIKESGVDVIKKGVVLEDGEAFVAEDGKVYALKCDQMRAATLALAYKLEKMMRG